MKIRRILEGVKMKLNEKIGTEKEIKIKDNVEILDIKPIFNIKTYDAILSLSIKPYKNFPSVLITHGEIVEIPRLEETEFLVEGDLQINSVAKSPEELYEILNLFKTYLVGTLKSVEANIQKIEKKIGE